MEQEYRPSFLTYCARKHPDKPHLYFTNHYGLKRDNCIKVNTKSIISQIKIPLDKKTHHKSVLGRQIFFIDNEIFHNV